MSNHPDTHINTALHIRRQEEEEEVERKEEEREGKRDVKEVHQMAPSNQVKEEEEKVCGCFVKRKQKQQLESQRKKAS